MKVKTQAHSWLKFKDYYHVFGFCLWTSPHKSSHFFRWIFCKYWVACFPTLMHKIIWKTLHPNWTAKELLKLSISCLTVAYYHLSGTTLAISCFSVAYYQLSRTTLAISCLSVAYHQLSTTTPNISNFDTFYWLKVQVNWNLD